MPSDLRRSVATVDRVRVWEEFMRRSSAMCYIVQVRTEHCMEVAFLANVKQPRNCVCKLDL